MKQQLGDLVSMGQHITTRGVLSAHRRFAEARLAAAFQRIVKHLPKLPVEDRFVWTNRRRKSNPLITPGTDAILAGQLAMRAAIETGDSGAIEGTALELEAFADEMKAQMLTEYHARTSGAHTLVSSGLAAHKEVGEATLALAEAMVSRSPGAIQHAIQEVTEANVTLSQFCAVARLESDSSARRHTLPPLRTAIT
jgi:hypothetical protein